MEETSKGLYIRGQKSSKYLFYDSDSKQFVTDQKMKDIFVLEDQCKNH